ncbi:MAG: haloalkane dehalogenase [Myxococcota bacterium]|nr:haloalkane dehalogenase [Myxococcota bacterium]
MKILRTPDERFLNLPDYDFEPHYVEVPSGDGGMLRMHYIDEGPGDGPVVLCMHGQPSWSYLDRHMVRGLVSQGYRVVCPDLIGYGRSDKLASMDDYSYARMVAWTTAWLEAVDLTDITLFCQDWGGLIGLHLVAYQPQRFARVVASNTGLPAGYTGMTPVFEQWRDFALHTPEFNAGKIISRGCVNRLSDDVRAAYDAPFPDESYKALCRIIPSLVPLTEDNPGVPGNRAAWERLKTFEKPFLCAFGDSDPITAGGDRPFLKFVPGAQGQAHTVVKSAGHFIQEDASERLVDIVHAFIAASS